MSPASPSPISGRCDPAGYPQGERVYFDDVSAMADYILAGNVALIDAVFCDPIGVWHHCTFAPSQVRLKLLKC